MAEEHFVWRPTSLTKKKHVSEEPQELSQLVFAILIIVWIQRRIPDHSDSWHMLRILAVNAGGGN